MLRLIKKEQLSLTSVTNNEEFNRFINDTLSSYYQACNSYFLMSEMDVVGGMIETFSELASNRLYGDKEFYKYLNVEDKMDFGMCLDTWYDEYVFDVIKVLESNQLAFYMDINGIYRNMPITKVW